MEMPDWLTRLFESIDHKDTEAFLALLSDDAIFRFGNAEPVKGKHSIRGVVDSIFGSVKTLHHDVRASWDLGDTSVSHGMVTYTKYDSSTLTVPFANILRRENNRVSEYLIFADVSELYGSA